MFRHLPEKTVEQLVEKNGNLRYQFEDLARRFPDSLEVAYGPPPSDAGEREKWLTDRSVEALRFYRSCVPVDRFIWTAGPCR
jgi:hypothetical protein